MKTPYQYSPFFSGIFRRVKRLYQLRKYRGVGKICPLCEGEFRSWINDEDCGTCPNCGSCPRHRLLWLYLKEQFDLWNSDREILHFAPEPCLSNKFRSMYLSSYTTADLSAPDVDIYTDITSIDFENDFFDSIICIHVLEHITDDQQAMRELYRVLRPNGSALVMVPYKQDGVTDEDPFVTSPQERKRRFGQFDHVRLYGVDLKNRLEDAGFLVEEVRPTRGMSKKEMDRYGLWNDVIFSCIKPMSAV